MCLTKLFKDFKYKLKLRPIGRARGRKPQKKKRVLFACLDKEPTCIVFFVFFFFNVKT